MGDKKTDMDRIGLFSEIGYVTIGDKYKSTPTQFNLSAGKGRQMLPGGVKIKTGLQQGYFSDKFYRILEGESYSDPIKMRRQNRMEDTKRNISKSFLPSSTTKDMCGLGNHYGTLSGPIQAMSPALRAGKPYKAPSKNVLTQPGKEGTGYGYIGVTIGPYPRYQSDINDRARELAKKEVESHKSLVKGGSFRLNMHPQAFFDGNPYRSDKPLPPVKSTGGKRSDVKPFRPSNPGKLLGGGKAGTFDPYPSHSQDPYHLKYKRQIHVVNKSGKTFMPSQGTKTTPCISILDRQVTRTVNVQNYRAMTMS